MKFTKSYAYSTDRIIGNYSGPGRVSNPDTWITGPDPIRREKYYAFIKHRSQANYRNEDYELEWSDWENLWPDDLWSQRGRSIQNLVLYRLDPAEEWSIDNVCVGTRREYFDHAKGTRRAKQ